MTVIFEKSVVERRANSQKWQVTNELGFDAKYLREDKPLLAEMGELEVLRHFTRRHSTFSSFAYKR